MKTISCERCQHKVIVGESECQSCRIKFNHTVDQIVLQINGDLSAELESWIADLQFDSHRHVKFLIENSNLPYLSWDNDGKYHVQDAKLHEHDVVNVAINNFCKNSSSYALYFSNYKQEGVPRITSPIAKAVEDIEKNPDAKPDDIETDDYYEIKKDYESGMSFRYVWGKHRSKFAASSKDFFVDARGFFPSVKRPTDNNYCRALREMVRSSYASWMECCKNHIQETKDLEESLDRQIKSAPNFELIKEFQKELESIGLSLSGRVNKRIFLFVESGGVPHPSIAAACNLAVSDKYKHLFGSKKDFGNSYAALKTSWKLSRRKPTISMPRDDKDYLVPFGLTGTGAKFTLKVENDRIVVGFSKFAEQKCKRSHAFANVSLETINSSGYQVTFQKKLKNNPKNPAVFRRPITGIVKEIKIKKKGDKTYLYLPINIMTVSNANSNLGFFLKTADEKKYKKDGLPNHFFIHAIDLNIGSPITASSAMIKKGESGTINALDYGGGNLIKEPFCLCADTKTSDSIKSLVNKFKKLKEAIKSCRAARKHNVPMDEDSEKFINEETNGQGNYRFLVQSLLSHYMKKKRAIWKRCRDNGHAILSECIRLLELMDIVRSTISCYSNMHIKDRTQYIPSFNVDEKRLNFRKYVSRKFASEISKYAVEMMDNYSGEHIFALEDLSMKGDFDSNNNSLARLFSPGQLLKEIEYSLAKIGISCVLIPPAGTSVMDAVSGTGASRSKLDKSCLYVSREGVVGKVDADLNATLNIMFLALNHAVVPYKFYVANGKSGKAEEGEGGIRLKRFFREMQIGKTVFFEHDGVLNVKKAGKPYTGYIYCTANGFVSQEQKIHAKEKIDEKIKQVLSSGSKLDDLAITPVVGKSYASFGLKEMLDGLKSFQQ